ncbi:hypothetical protein [Bacillus sp. AFS088145]|uniref:hypothetical protein n=1 Tax=Bacillus sp. AFS088145 TaxID=2033514 RepID=UPI000BF3DF9E|nr:hypothetical protein [Bacillus sp. AFS088145]PFH83611.1 hypothetical protein COI44_17545 [Bacillus sp. AFS088145]
MKNYQVVENCKEYSVQKQKVQNAVEVTNQRIVEINAEVSHLKEDYLKSMDDAVLVKINKLKAEEITLAETLPLKRQLSIRNRDSKYELTAQDHQDINDMNKEFTKYLRKDADKLLKLLDEVDKLVDKLQNDLYDKRSEVSQYAIAISSATGLPYYDSITGFGQGDINRKIMDLNYKHIR